jgi:hypothetical protein
LDEFLGDAPPPPNNFSSKISSKVLEFLPFSTGGNFRRKVMEEILEEILEENVLDIFLP